MFKNWSFPFIKNIMHYLSLSRLEIWKNNFTIFLVTGEKRKLKLLHWSTVSIEYALKDRYLSAGKLIKKDPCIMI